MGALDNIFQRLKHIYHLYCFYASPIKLILRRTLTKEFSFSGPCPRILEIGGGNSTIKPLLQDVCQATEFISSEIEPTGATMVVCDGQNLPFSDLCIDLVCAFEVLEHITETDRVLSEIIRVLKPEGYVVLSIPFLLGTHDFYDFYRWTEQGLRVILRRHGLQVRTLQKTGGTFSTLVILTMNFIRSRLLPSPKGWRTHRLVRKLAFGGLTFILFPFVPLLWLGYGLDRLLDRDSINAPGYVCIAQKIN